MEPFSLLISWLIFRLQSVYQLLNGTLGLPSPVVFIISTLLAAAFFFSIYDIITKREKVNSGWWMLAILVVPLSPVLYVFLGRSRLASAPYRVKTQPVPANTRNTKAVATRSALGSVVLAIGLIVGVSAVVFFIFILIAIASCVNDPKCM